MKIEIIVYLAPVFKINPRMKRITYYLSSLLVLAAFGMSSCTSEEPQPAPNITYENDVPNGTLIVNYTVQVVPGNGSKDGRIGGIPGVSVSITQDGETSLATTDQAGLAHFPGMSNGTVSGTVTDGGDAYVTMSFTANIDAGPVQTDNEQTRYSSSTVTIFERNAALDGRIWGDYKEILPPGVDPPNLGTGEFTEPTYIFVVYEIGSDYPMGSGTGALTSINMEWTSFWLRSSSLGVINLTEIPGTVDGVLSATFFMEDLEIDDPTPGSDKIFLYNIQPIENSQGISLNLIPNSTYHLGDKQALKKI
jgi:hypothetical protein